MFRSLFFGALFFSAYVFSMDIDKYLNSILLEIENEKAQIKIKQIKTISEGTVKGSLPEGELCLESPLRGYFAISITKNGEKDKINVKKIYFADRSFSKGYFCCLNPYSIETFIVFSGSNPVWKSSAEKLLQYFNFCLQNHMESKEDLCKDSALVLAAITFIHENLYTDFTENQKLIDGIVYDKKNPENDKLVCRHFATLALPIFDQIFKISNEFNGSIQKLTSGEFKDGLKKQNGHEWNIITFTKENRSSNKFFVDVYNKAFAQIDTVKSLENITMISIDQNGELLFTNIDSESFYYKYLIVTNERAPFIHNENKRKAACRLEFDELSKKSFVSNGYDNQKEVVCEAIVKEN
jgi:hypothetical protein